VQNFWEVFESAATRFGGRTAVEVQRKSALERVSYAELRRMAVAIGGWLAASAGIAPGDRCAILADNDAQWCAAYLGALRIGAVAVPLDTNYTAPQVAKIAADAGARVLFAGPRLLPVAREALASLPGVRLVLVHGAEPGVEALDAILTTPAAEPPPCPAGPSDRAVLLYTSGTTSDPKGVVLTHGNLAAEREAAFAVVDLNERDSVLGVLPLFHALAQMGNLLLPFALGARVVFLETLGTSELLKALAERQITIFVCVPQFFYLIHQRVTAEVAKGGGPRKTAFKALLATNLALRGAGINLGPIVFAKVHRVLGEHMRLLVTGGSKFDPAIGRDLYGMGFSIIQAYGLTETSGAATINRPEEAHIDTVGQILPGNELRILPPEGDAPDGEIAIRGPLVMEGYFNRPDATAAVMRDGWFLTGDLGRLDERGRLTITGRKKEVIVLSNGKNIYPEEIEAHYRQSPLIKELCVMGRTREDEPSAERLYAVVVPNEEVVRERKIVNTGDWLRYEMEGLSVALPAYKRVLGYEVWFEPLPRTTTGKLKRFEILRRLKDRQLARAEAASLPPSAEDQAWAEDPHVAAAMALVRGRAAPDAALKPGANLELDLGLDSMERVELLAELEQRFGVKVPPSVSQDIHTLGQLIDAVRPAEGTAGGGAGETPWAAILRSLPPDTDPVLSGLLESRPLAQRALFVVSRVARTAIGRVEVSGLEHLPAKGPYIVCPNHQSFIDAFVLGGVIPYAIMEQMFAVGATQHFATPIRRRLARLINCVPVDPDANLVPAMQAGAFGLAHGKILLLFPEGERSIDGTVKLFRKGAPILSAHLGVPMVPVAIKGAYEVWPRNRPIDWSKAGPVSGHRVKIAIGAPIRVAEGEPYAAGAERLRAAVQAMWDRL
jgi:long-chain acyl-CoA synthetase